MNEVKQLSYAKVNLTLDVLRRRPDGYHEIDSVAVLIDITDEMEISRAGGGLVEVAVEAGDAPTGPDNLICRAAKAFFRRVGIRGGAQPDRRS